jgi:hypothetical protein
MTVLTLHATLLLFSLTIETTEANQSRRRELLWQMDAIIHELQVVDLQDNLSPESAPSQLAPSFVKGDRVRVTSSHTPTWHRQTGTIQAPRRMTCWNVLMDLRPRNSRRHLIYQTPKHLELLPKEVASKASIKNVSD